MSEEDQRIICLKREAKNDAAYYDLARKIDADQETLANPSYVASLQNKLIAWLSPLIQKDKEPTFFTINEYINKKPKYVPENDLQDYNPSPFLERVKSSLYAICRKPKCIWYWKSNTIIALDGYLISTGSRSIQTYNRFLSA